MINKIAILIPTYPPHFSWAYQLRSSIYKYGINNQADIWFVFTNESESTQFNNCENKIILPPELVKSDGIINVKKLYGVNYLHDKYEYIIVLDDESKFIRRANLQNICEKFFTDKKLYGNVAKSKICNESGIIKNACRKFFKFLNNKYPDFGLYLWFNQLCIYRGNTIPDFFEYANIDYAKLNSLTFDYYLYMYYLLLHCDFKVIDLGIISDGGAWEGGKIISKNKSLLVMGGVWLWHQTHIVKCGCPRGVEYFYYIIWIVKKLYTSIPYVVSWHVLCPQKNCVTQ